MLVAELEQKRKGQMRRVKDVPEPFGLDLTGLSEHQVVQKVWAEADRLEQGRASRCDKLCLYNKVPLPRLTMEDPLLRGLSKFSNPWHLVVLPY